MSLAELTDKVLALPLEERWELANKLWESLPPTSDLELGEDEELMAEIERREAEVEAGIVPEVDFRAALAELRESLQ